MTVTPTRGGYPMLRISQEFNLPYSDVLQAAQSLRSVGARSQWGSYDGQQLHNAQALARCSNVMGAVSEIKRSLEELDRIPLEGVELG